MQNNCYLALCKEKKQKQFNGGRNMNYFLIYNKAYGFRIAHNLEEIDVDKTELIEDKYLFLENIYDAKNNPEFPVDCSFAIDADESLISQLKKQRNWIGEW